MNVAAPEYPEHPEQEVLVAMLLNNLQNPSVRHVVLDMDDVRRVLAWQQGNLVGCSVLAGRGMPDCTSCAYGRNEHRNRVEAELENQGLRAEVDRLSALRSPSSVEPR